MKIAIVNNNMEYGGVQKALVNLLREISDLHEITLVLFSATGGYMKSIPQNVTVIECKSMYSWLGKSQEQLKNNKFQYLIRGFFVFFTKLFGKVIPMKIINLSQKEMTIEYDCAISYLHSAPLKSFYGGCNEFVISKIKANTKITFLHCDYSQCGSNHKYNNYQFEKFDKIIACSEGCKNAFVNILPQYKAKTKVVPNCQNFDDIKHKSMFQPHVYSCETINIIMVARLSGEKGIDRAIMAVRFLKDKGISLMLHIVGDGILRDSLELMVRTLNLEDTVFFYGGTDNPYRYMKNADLLLITSYHEAAPMVIDEACCLGIPILSVNTTSAKDMIVDRKCGWVCDNSQEALNEAMLSLLTQREKIDMVHNRLTQKEYSNKLSIEKFGEVLNEVNEYKSHD